MECVSAEQKDLGVALPDVVLGSCFSMAGKVAGVPDKRRRATLSLQACDMVRARCGITCRINIFRYSWAPRMHCSHTVAEWGGKFMKRIEGVSSNATNQLPF